MEPTMLPQRGGYTYGFIGDQLICRKGGSTQAVVGFLRVARTTEHHDEELQDLTERIDELVSGHGAARRRSDGRELSMILTPDGWMLAYTLNQYDQDWSAESRSGEVLDLDTGDAKVIREKLGLA